MTRIIAAAGTFEDWLDPVAALVDECKLHLNPEGAEIMAVDPANVAMVKSVLSPNGTDAYDVGGETIGIDLDRLQDVLGIAGSDDLVFFNFDTQTRKLTVQISNHEFDLATINPQTVREEPDIPDLDLPTEFVVDGEMLNSALTVADLCGDHVTVRCDGSELRLEGEGDTDTGVTAWDEEDLIEASFGDARSLFSLDYMTDIGGVIDNDAEATCLVGEEYPIDIQFAAAEGHVEIRYYVSPRIQSGGSA